MAININDPARGQRALGNAYNKLLQENAGLRINIEAQDLLVGEQTVEIVRLGTMVTDLGGDPEAGDREANAGQSEPAPAPRRGQGDRAAGKEEQEGCERRTRRGGQIRRGLGRGNWGHGCSIHL